MLEQLQTYIEDRGGEPNFREMLLSTDIDGIFDCDDTMYKSSQFQAPSFERAVNRVRAAHRIQGQPIRLFLTDEEKQDEKLAGQVDTLVAKVKGKETKAILGILFDEVGISKNLQADLIDEAVRYREEALFEVARERLLRLQAEGKDFSALLMPGMDDIVRLVRERAVGSGTVKQFGVASQSPDEYVNFLISNTTVDGLPITDVFPEQGVVGSSKANRASATLQAEMYKPRPYPVLRSRAGLGENPVRQKRKHLLYIGDGRSDIDTFLMLSRQHPKREKSYLNKRVTALIIPTSDRSYSSLSSEFGRTPGLYFRRSLKEVAA